ncbi:MAG: Na+ dependent nucleoside transporter N-terminal domain-containing protein, partial [Kangiellaceae bacterium]|nr:Na+ dependent nucleoside transporter N-terminal domain-containing protein [Kangiellaceae bacterium]
MRRFMNYFCKALLALVIGISSINAQKLEKTWQFESIKNVSGQTVYTTTASDTLRFESGKFNYSLRAKNNLRARGDYLYQNNILVLYYSLPKDTIRHYRIKELTDSTLVFTENKIIYSYKPYVGKKTATNQIIPSKGFTLNGLMRGILGMFILLFIAFLLCRNRKAINWRTVIFGLLAQLVLAIGVLKISFVQAAFEWVGGLFVSILDFTMAGTKFLFAAFGSGEIADSLLTFAVSILPTI